MTAVARQPSDATIYRLSLYHCYLGELLRTQPDATVTSQELAQHLNIKEETIRKDISHVGRVGRSRVGYRASSLFGAIQDFLGLEEEYPVIRIGRIEMLQALKIVFPPSAYGVRPVAYFSEQPEDVGIEIDGIPVRHITELPDLDPALGVSVALVACSPSWVQVVVDQCVRAGITGILLLTPALRVNVPPDVNLIQVRMPCDIKSLACKCRLVREPL